MTGIECIIRPTIKLRPNPTSTLGGMVENRDEHREPVIRAFVALPVETLVEVTVRCLPGSGLCVSAISLNRDEQTMYKAKEVTKLTGSEPFINTDKQFTVLDFWQYGFSNLNSNVLRGALAEFLVENALKDADDIVIRNPWGDFDVEYQGKKIEVKCCSYLQDWDQAKLSTIRWSGLKAKDLYWGTAVNGEYVESEASYKSDIYVLSLLKHKDPDTLDILDMSQWSFYVLSKEELFIIADNSSAVSLYRLEQHNIQEYGFDELADIIRTQI